MIYYFSATGNSQHVATRIAEALGTQAQSIETANTEIRPRRRRAARLRHAHQLERTAGSGARIHPQSRHPLGEGQLCFMCSHLRFPARICMRGRTP